MTFGKNTLSFIWVLHLRCEAPSKVKMTEKRRKTVERLLLFRNRLIWECSCHLSQFVTSCWLLVTSIMWNSNVQKVSKTTSTLVWHRVHIWTAELRTAVRKHHFLPCFDGACALKWHYNLGLAKTVGVQGTEERVLQGWFFFWFWSLMCLLGHDDSIQEKSH